MSRLIEVLLLWSMAFFYGAVSIITMLVQIYKKGFGKVFGKSKHERPAGLDDPALGTHGFLHLENVKIHYVASGPEDKPLMLFVHGFPEFWYSWRNQIKEFQKDYRCVAIDQRGYGESDKPADIEQYTQKILINDIKQIIHALGYKSCVLVAHDWGGAVAWTFGRFFPDMVDRLIIMNAPSNPIFKKLIRSNKKQAKMSWYMFFFQLPRLPEIILSLGDYQFFDSFGTSKGKETDSFVNPLSQEEVNAYKYTFSQKGAMTPPLNFYRAALQLDPLVYDMNYTMPVLVIWGMKDLALCSANADEMEQSSKMITVKRIPESGHFVQMDAPDAVNKIMREWLTADAN